MQSRVLVAAAAAAAIAASLPVVEASNPVGVIGVVNKVTMFPDETRPTTVQVQGAFSISNPGPINYSDWPTSYSKPRAGYLYYKVALGQNALCHQEWADLKAVAGTNAVVAFGYRGNLTSLRANDVKPDAPDTYPLNVGLVTMAKASEPGSDMVRTFFADLRAAAARTRGVGH